MNYRLEELIDIKKVQPLLENFSRITGIVTALLDLDGNILISAGWRDICTKFHRVCPETAKRCTESDTALVSALAEGQEYTVYECLNGLIDIAVPIIVGGEHLGNLFTGQFLFEAPDIEKFRSQANKFGFDEAAYLEALSRVPIIPKSEIKAAIKFLLNLTGILAEMGLDRIKQLETVALLERREEELKIEKDFTEAALNSMEDMFYVFDLDGRIIRWNDSLNKVTGYDDREIASMSLADFFIREDRERLAAAIALALKDGFAQVDARMQTKDSEIIPFGMAGALLKDGEGKPIGICGTGRDISERIRAEEELEKHRLHLEELVAERTAELRNSNEKLQVEIAKRKEAEVDLKEKLKELEIFHDATIDREFRMEELRVEIRHLQELQDKKE